MYRLKGKRDHREARLKTQLDAVQGDYDHIIIDCPPAVSWLIINGFTAAKAVVVIVPLLNHCYSYGNPEQIRQVLTDERKSNGEADTDMGSENQTMG